MPQPAGTTWTSRPGSCTNGHAAENVLPARQQQTCQGETARASARNQSHSQWQRGHKVGSGKLFAASPLHPSAAKTGDHILICISCIHYVDGKTGQSLQSTAGGQVHLDAQSCMPMQARAHPRLLRAAVGLHAQPREAQMHHRFQQGTGVTWGGGGEDVELGAFGDEWGGVCRAGRRGRQAWGEDAGKSASRSLA